jgi:peptide/nickel transport system substrate-binding protein
MRNEDQQALTTGVYPRRTVLRTGLGAVSLAAGGLLSGGSAGAVRRQAEGGELPADAAEEQVLRIQTGSGGSVTFDFQPLTGGSDMEFWLSLYYLPPMYFDIDLNLKPLIFDSWEGNEDSTVWTFTIDPRAHWSDGTPITAAQVKGSWEIMADPLAGNSRIQDYMGNVKGFDQVLSLAEKEAPGLVVKDERTLEVQLVVSDPIFHWRIATHHMAPVKAEEAREDIEFFWRPENNPACSGPYRLESWDPDRGTAVMGKNPDWWLGEGQYLDRIEFRYVNEQGTVVLMIRNGEVDIAHPDQVLPAELEPEFPGLFRPVIAFGYNSFWLSPTNEPTNDINVRKALMLAVNFDDVYQAAFPVGGGVKVDQLLDPDLPCRAERPDQEWWYPYDPEAAQGALAESSYGSADNLPVIRVTPRGERPQNVRALEAVLEFWRQNLGITNVAFELSPEGFGPEETLINLSRDDVLVRFPDSATYMLVAAYSTSAIPRDAMLGYQNEELDALIERALATPPEDPQRCELALEAQQMFMDDYVAMVFGAEESRLNAREYVQNYKRGPDRTFIEPWQLYIAAE